MPRKMKWVMHNETAVGEIEASDDPHVEVERSMALLKTLGLWNQPSTVMSMFNNAAAFTHASAQIYERLLADPAQMARGAAPFVVNSTFAIEIYLKTLSMLHGKKTRGHELMKLFKALPERIQERIGVDYPKFAQAKGIESTISLEELLLANNKAFENWRYSYELPSTNLFHIRETIALMEALHKLGTEILNEQKKP